MRLAGLVLGLGAFSALLVLPAPAGLDPQGWRVAALAVLMAAWWMSEAVPVAATALLPVVALPALGVTGVAEATRPYAHPLVFLFLGGFLIALAIERWGLHRRIALRVLRISGEKPAHLVGAFMGACALLSMWVSNTATTIMMVPIAASVIAALDADDTPLPRALMLGVAYSASIGGVGTLIGTPPNALLAGFVEQTYGVRIGFGQWMLVGVPVAAAMLVLAWLLLTRALRRDASMAGTTAGATGASSHLAGLIADLGPITRGERLVGLVFAVAATLWVTRPLIEPWLPDNAISDTGIAVACALALFIIPVNLRAGEFLLTWEWAERLPWGVLLLFGGGLSLASAIASTGLAGWIGNALTGLGSLPPLAVVAALVALVIFLTELTSNTATTAAFLPVVAALAGVLGVAPLTLLAPAAIAASCAFMMPVATPPNAIVYASGAVTIPEMMRAGLWLNVLGIAVVTLLVYVLAPMLA